MSVIYAISCPETKVVKYVGRAYEFDKRMYRHLCCAKNKKNLKYPLYVWINDLFNRGLTPEFSILCNCEMDVSVKEKYYIHLHAKTILNIETLGVEHEEIDTEYLEQLRKDKKLTHAEIAAKMNVSKACVRNYLCQNKTHLSFKKAKELERIITNA